MVENDLGDHIQFRSLSDREEFQYAELDIDQRRGAERVAPHPGGPQQIVWLGLARLFIADGQFPTRIENEALLLMLPRHGAFSTEIERQDWYRAEAELKDKNQTNTRAA